MPTRKMSNGFIQEESEINKYKHTSNHETLQKNPDFSKVLWLMHMYTSSSNIVKTLEPRRWN